MPKILFDRQIFNLQTFGGISKYFTKIITGLQHLEDYNVLVEKSVSDNEHLQNTNIPNSYNVTIPGNFRGKQRIQNYLLNLKKGNTKGLLINNDFDVFHPTYYNPNFLNYLSADKPFVITVHDMIHELYFQDLFQYVHPESSGKSILLPKAAHIIAVSQNTKRDILKIFPNISEDKISVIYHGSSLDSSVIDDNLKLPLKYILFVGKRAYYKNFIWLIKTLAPYLIANQITLLCAGGGELSDYEKLLIDELNIGMLISYHSIENEIILNTLYKKAICLVFPSKYEGFGIPIVEAFSAECPVIVSNASCFPEIAGEAALYFELDDAIGLIDQIDTLVNDKNLSNTLISIGKERLRLFNWDNAVKQHAIVYKSVQSKY